MYEESDEDVGDESSRGIGRDRLSLGRQHRIVCAVRGEPTFIGIAAARTVDDTGKAAFRPAWASAITLDAMQEIGEIAGPALAGILWQTGGVFLLFGVRIAIAIIPEISAIAVFGELQNYRPRLRILNWARKNRRRGSI